MLLCEESHAFMTCLGRHPAAKARFGNCTESQLTVACPATFRTFIAFCARSVVLAELIDRANVCLSSHCRLRLPQAKLSGSH